MHYVAPGKGKLAWHLEYVHNIKRLNLKERNNLEQMHRQAHDEMGAEHHQMAFLGQEGDK